MPDDTPLLIFDLDGTLLSVNSYPHWVRYLLTGRFDGLDKKERLAVSGKAAVIPPKGNRKKPQARSSVGEGPPKFASPTSPKSLGRVRTVVPLRHIRATAPRC